MASDPLSVMMPTIPPNDKNPPDLLHFLEKYTSFTEDQATLFQLSLAHLWPDVPASPRHMMDLKRGYNLCNKRLPAKPLPGLMAKGVRRLDELYRVEEPGSTYFTT